METTPGQIVAGIGGWYVLVLLLAAMLAVWIIVFMVTRAFWLWYWKVEERLSHQRMQTALLREQNELLRRLVPGRFPDPRGER